MITSAWKFIEQTLLAYSEWSRKKSPFDSEIGYKEARQEFGNKRNFTPVYVLSLSKHHSGDRLFHCSKTLQKALLKSPVYFNEGQALDHGRFLGDNCNILKIFVPDTAIEACNCTLNLRHKLVGITNLHGCFLGEYRHNVYIQNPNFKQDN